MRLNLIDAFCSPAWRHFSLAGFALITVLVALPWASSCGDADLVINGSPPQRTRTILEGTQTPDPNDPEEL